MHARGSVRLTQQGRIGRITLNRPEQHNALDVEDIERFSSLLDEVEENSDVRVLVVTGTGEHTFCAGASLKQLEAGQMRGELFETLTNRLAAVRMPTICGLNGSAYGGGTEIALSCDFRIGVVGSKMSVPAAKLGLCYPLGGLRRYVERLGLSAAKRVLVANEELDAAEMMRIGFLSQVVPRDELESTVEAYAVRIAGLAPLAAQSMKRILNGIAAGTLDSAEAGQLIDRCAESADLREGLRARRVGESPQFEGE